jgi:hypothetical protein
VAAVEPAAVAALLVVGVAVAAVVAAAEVVGVVPAEVSAEAATEAIGLLPTTTCSRVDSRLLNNPCVDDELELDVPDVESVLDSVLASFCTDLLWPWCRKPTVGVVDVVVVVVALNDMMAPLWIVRQDLHGFLQWSARRLVGRAAKVCRTCRHRWPSFAASRCKTTPGLAFSPADSAWLA